MRPRSPTSSSLPGEPTAPIRYQQAKHFVPMQHDRMIEACRGGAPATATHMSACSRSSQADGAMPLRFAAASARRARCLAALNSR